MRILVKTHVTRLRWTYITIHYYSISRLLMMKIKETAHKRSGPWIAATPFGLTTTFWINDSLIYSHNFVASISLSTSNYLLSRAARTFLLYPSSSESCSSGYVFGPWKASSQTFDIRPRFYLFIITVHWHKFGIFTGIERKTRFRQLIPTGRRLQGWNGPSRHRNSRTASP